LLDMQRCDAHQRAVAADQRAAAPEGVRRRGEDRALQEVLPIAGEFLARDDQRLDGVAPAAAGGDDRRILDAQAAGVAELERRQSQPAECLDEAESGLLIESDDMTLRRPTIARAEPQRLRLGDEVADGEHEAVLAD